MKKIAALLLLLALLCLAGCSECEHNWRYANCLEPKTCNRCGVTEGEVADHSWLEANCEEPKRCAVCKNTEGAALGHHWQEADCETAKTCTVCQKTEGTALGHSWQDADCVTAKTCVICSVTEGEPLGHTLVEANYQAPVTCVHCDHTEGEKLTAEFDQYDVNVIPVQLGVKYDYVANCYIPGYTTVGQLWWDNYQIFDGDETHEAVEGYEWHSVTVKISFSDRNARKYGFVVQSALGDYYWYSAQTENGYTDAFTVSSFGKLYDQCLRANGYGTVSEWEGNTCTYTATFAWRVPVDYDGHLIVFYEAGEDLTQLLENGDTSVLVFQFA